MRYKASVMTILLTVLLCGQCFGLAAEPFQFVDLFNGKDLSGWVNVNTAKDTWAVQEGVLTCTGKPIGILRTAEQYENFILKLEWKHLSAGGNSGVFVWSEALPFPEKRLPRGIEVQILELDWAVQHKATDAYVHGEVFGTMGLNATPDTPRGNRSKSIEKRCKGKGQWNSYTIVCVDGVIKLAVNGKFVNGISQSPIKKGYICLESEGAPIHFRNVQIMTLPAGVTTKEQTAPEADPARQ